MGINLTKTEDQSLSEEIKKYPTGSRDLLYNSGIWDISIDGVPKANLYSCIITEIHRESFYSKMHVCEWNMNKFINIHWILSAGNP